MYHEGLRILLELNSSDIRIGAVNDALDLAHFTQSHGVRIFFCGALNEGMMVLAKKLGIPVVSGRSRMLSKLGLPLFALSVLSWVVKLLWVRPHVVHLNYAGYGPSLAYAAHLYGVPVVARAGGEYDFNNRANHWIKAYVANCQAHAQTYLDSPLADRVFIAGDLFRPERLAKVTEPERPLPIRKGKPRFLFLGQLVERKGIVILLEAFARMQNDADLLLVGGNWDKSGYPQQLRSLIHRLKLDDRIYLENHRSDVALLLQQCDVFILPSLSEARPRTIIEAMCMGRPVISTFVGGIPSLVEDGVTGLLVPPSDAQALAVALDRLAGSEELRQKFGQSGLERARASFHPERTVERYLTLYRALSTSSSLPRS